MARVAAVARPDAQNVKVLFVLCFANFIFPFFPRGKQESLLPSLRKKIITAFKFLIRF